MSWWNPDDFEIEAFSLVGIRVTQYSESGCSVLGSSYVMLILSHFIVVKLGVATQTGQYRRSLVKVPDDSCALQKAREKAAHRPSVIKR